MKFLQPDQGLTGKGEKVLTSVIRMAKWLNMPSIVEGVETLSQVDFLKCIGAEYAQGFYSAKPMPVEEYEKFVAKERENKCVSPVSENEVIVNELWNTRSNVSLLFDILDTPIAIYEYRKNKVELLRTNKKYDEVINFDEDIDDEEYKRRLSEQIDLLMDAFETIDKGDIPNPIEYELTEDVWYQITVKLMGRRSDTNIMMVTFTNISQYK